MDTPKTITHLGLCAGYGGIEIGLHRVIRNLRTVALCEIEAFACANLVSKMEAGLMDAAPIWSNLKTFPWAEFRDRVDILTGGYPCQPFSAAGKRLGTEDPRHLWPFIADGIRLLRPRLCYFENVEGHISLGLREVVGELEQIGYSTAWGIFSAAEVGAPHQRKRVFILAVSNSLGGAAGLSRSLAWNEGVAGVADNGGDKGTIGIPNTSHNRLEEHPQCSIQPNKSRGRDGDFGRVHSCPWPSQLANAGCIEPQGWGSATQGQQSGAGRIPRSQPAPCNDQAWPSRPGEPQHGWEPPRVVHSNRDGCIGNVSRDEAEQVSNGTDYGISGAAGAMGNAECVLLPTAGEHRAMDEASGIPADGEGRKPSQADSDASLARSGEDVANPVRSRGEEPEHLDANLPTEPSRGDTEGVGNADHGRLASGIDAGSGTEADRGGQSDIEQAEPRQIEPALGRNAPRRLHGVDLAELSGLSNSELAEICEWMVKTDNRTDELRLLGNGVVPATAERAFRTLWEEFQ